MLLAHTPVKVREQVVFEIVSHFNRSSMLITSQEERDQLAELNLIAGKRARSAAAYSSALSHFAAGLELVKPELRGLPHLLVLSSSITPPNANS